MKDGLQGDTIRKARIENEMTQEQLAEEINISPTFNMFHMCRTNIYFFAGTVGRRNKY